MVYKIPVVWTMMGYMNIEAENLESACNKVMDAGAELPEDGNFLDDSFGIDKEGLQEQADKESADLDALPEEYFK
jgi:hypothetical protein